MAAVSAPTVLKNYIVRPLYIGPPAITSNYKLEMSFTLNSVKNIIGMSN